MCAGACLSAHRLVKADGLRCTVFRAFEEFEPIANDGAPLQCGLAPSVVVAAQKIETGKHALAPFSDLNKIRAEPSQGAPQVKRGPAAPRASPPTRATHQEGADAPDAFYIPYWWVRETDKEGLANVALVLQSNVHVSFKACKNIKTLQQFDNRLVYYAGEHTAPLQSANRAKLSEGGVMPKTKAKK
eukprot:1704351-Pyramimonas_sp.AAC.1